MIAVPSLAAGCELAGMTVLRCATLTVADVDAAVARFGKWFDYRSIESGLLDSGLAASWQAPESAGRKTALCRPASGSPIYLRFVEGEPVPDYRAIRSFGWAAIELCVIDVDQVHRAIAGSPFAVIGPPTAVGGLPTIKPMQVRGPDQETIYLTQILTTDPAEGLPRPASLVDHLFILVLACQDMTASARWFAERLDFAVSEPLAIRYSMINKAFELPPEKQHRIATARADGHVFLEFDEYPAAATARPRHPAALPPGVAIGTLALPGLDRLALDWLTPPTVRAGALYGGRRSGTVLTPEGALLELVEAE